ncbi:MAG: TRAP transporter small permease [Proteobacteria bacterium]|nr:TRAP transporter small permease [Pseudomonadota bacterium]MBI3496615.1 TRAP transporter small permease [Pseudomonadota bacterium]
MTGTAYRFALWLTRACETIAAVLVLLVVVFNTAQVFFRYVVGDPLGWTEEAMRYSMVWVAFLGSSALVFRGEHPAIQIGRVVKSRVLAASIHYLGLAAIASFSAILVWKGLPVAIGNRSQTSPAAQIPMIYPYLAVGVGGSLMLIKVACLLVLPPGTFAASESDVRAGDVA